MTWWPAHRKPWWLTWPWQIYQRHTLRLAYLAAIRDGRTPAARIHAAFEALSLGLVSNRDIVRILTEATTR